MRVWLFLLSCLLLFFAIPRPTHAQTDPQVKQDFYKARVIRIENEGIKEIGSAKNAYQTVRVSLLEGPDRDKEVTFEHGGMFTITQSQKVAQGDTVIVSRTQTPDKKITYRITDKYRLNTILSLIVGFFVVVLAVAGRRGAGAIAGMVISLAVIIFFIVPRILAGNDPLVISIIGSIVILVTTIYLAHGIKPQTHIALIATLASLLLTALLSILFVNLAKLSGLGTEDAYSLQQLFNNTINFQGLLLGGIIIGSLGVLDDVTTTQSATITELAESNEKSTFRELVQKGMNVGRTHIASVVNTLILAYAGASMGMFIFLVLGTQNNIQPLWVILNSEVITEEIIRSLAGSLGLILAVPITTLLAAFFAKYSVKIK